MKSLLLEVYQLFDGDGLRNTFFDGISKKTFSVHKEKYFEKLKQEHGKSAEEVIFEGERGKKYYKVRDIEVAKGELTFPNVKPKVAEKWELILKALIIDEIIPVQDEIVRATGIPSGTVKKYITQMRKEGIIEPYPVEEPIVDEETGEILRDKRIVKNYVYYGVIDIGIREKIPDDFNPHRNFATEFVRRKNEIKSKFARNQDKYNDMKATNSATIFAMKELAKISEYKEVRREPKYPIAYEYYKQIKEIYCRS